MQQVLFDDFIHVLLACVGIPDALGVNYQYRALVASVHAAGVIDANTRFSRQTQLFDALLGIITHARGTFVSAARFTIRALVNTKKQMVLIVRFRHVRALAVVNLQDDRQ